MDHYKLPKRARLAKGVRLLHPLNGTFYKYGGRWVTVKNWTEDGHIIVGMAFNDVAYDVIVEKKPTHDVIEVRNVVFFLVTPEQIGVQAPREPEQLSFNDISDLVKKRPSDDLPPVGAQVVYRQITVKSEWTGMDRVHFCCAGWCTTCRSFECKQLFHNKYACPKCGPLSFDNNLMIIK